MKSKLLTSLLTTAVFAGVLPVSAYAVTTPTFPSCVNPQGALKVSYDNGVHGIVGMDGERTGSDKVYSLSDYDQLLQCFCPENGNGIQTNWWKADKLSGGDIDILKKEGWLYVADGSAWGLQGAPYVAKNYDYNCKPTTTTVTPTPAPENPVKEVLKLADTGNIAFLYALLAAGTVSLLTGLILRLKK